MSDRPEIRWPTGRQLDGGVDVVPLPAEIPGRLLLCGKHAVVSLPEGPGTIVCLTERHELADRYPHYVDRLDREVGTRWWPVPDLHAPSLEVAVAIIDEVIDLLTEGDDVVIHCGAGIGRAGTIAVGVLIRLGWPLERSLESVGRARPGAGPEVGAQLDLVGELARLGGRRRAP